MPFVHFSRPRCVVALALCALALSPCARADDPVVARLDDITLKASEVRTLLDGLDPALRKQLSDDPKALTRLVRTELGRRAVLDEARQRHWDQRPDVTAQIERLKTDIVLSSYLKSVTTVPATFPTDEQLHKVYDANLDRFMEPRKYHLAQIFIARPTDGGQTAIEAAKARAAELATKAKAAGSGFGDLARTPRTSQARRRAAI
jgi:hypothetical protein